MQTAAKMTCVPAAAAGFDLDVEEMTAARLRAAFETEGAVIVRGLLGDARVGELRDSVRSLIAAQLRHAGRDPDPAADIDTLFNALCAIDRRLGSAVHQAVREVPAFYALLLHPWVQDVVKTLLDVEMLHVPYDKAVFRIDSPDEPRPEAHWRQDYADTLMSEPTVTVWTPLTPVTEAMGPLHIVPRSHDRLHRVRLEPGPGPDGESRPGAAAVLAELDPDVLDRRAVTVCLEPGDALFFHQLLLHRCGRNLSDRWRWSMVPRYGKVLDEHMVARGWTIGRTPDHALLRQLRPDAIAPEG